jgi:hypothetical protein
MWKPPEGFYAIVTIYSDGQHIAVDFPEWLTPFFNKEIIKRCKDCLEDSFYRVRPDLRPQ